jgi:hypothetical protein
MVTLARIAIRLIEDALRWLVLLSCSNETLRAENLFLRRQLASRSREHNDPTRSAYREYERTSHLPVTVSKHQD